MRVCLYCPCTCKRGSAVAVWKIKINKEGKKHWKMQVHLGTCAECRWSGAEPDELVGEEEEGKRGWGGASFDWGYVKDEGGSRGDVEVAGTGGKTAGGEGIRKKKPSW